MNLKASSDPTHNQEEDLSLSNLHELTKTKSLIGQIFNKCICTIMHQWIFSPYRLDRDSSGREIYLYVREDMPFKMKKANLEKTFEGFFIEIDIRRKVVS